MIHIWYTTVHPYVICLPCSVPASVHVPSVVDSACNVLRRLPPSLTGTDLESPPPPPLLPLLARPRPGYAEWQWSHILLRCLYRTPAGVFECIMDFLPLPRVWRTSLLRAKRRASLSPHQAVRDVCAVVDEMVADMGVLAGTRLLGLAAAEAAIKSMDIRAATSCIKEHPHPPLNLLVAIARHSHVCICVSSCPCCCCCCCNLRDLLDVSIL